VKRTSQTTDDALDVVSRGKKLAYALCLVVALGLVFVYALQRSFPDFIYTFSNVVPPFIAGAAVLSSFFALRKYWESFGSRLSEIWLSFAAGMILWFLGELGWALYTMVLGIEIPYPSIADVFWLVGYVPLFIALLLYIQLFQPAISSRMFFGAAAIVAGATAATFLTLMMPVLAGASEQDFITLSISFAYPALDLALFLEAIIGLLVFTFTRMKSRVGRAWHFINSAILLNAVADMSFSYFTLEGTYYNGHPQELLFHFGYLLFALAFYVHSREL